MDKLTEAPIIDVTGKESLEVPVTERKESGTEAISVADIANEEEILDRSEGKEGTDSTGALINVKPIMEEVRNQSVRTSLEVLANNEVTAAADEEEQDGSNSVSMVSSDYLCPICLDLLHEPRTVEPCHHVFCDPCLRRLGVERYSRCPMCRAQIRECQPNQELSETVRQTFPKRYEDRASMERESGVFELPLPPVRRPFYERVSEWILMHLSNPYCLTVLALMAVIVQLAVVVSLSMLNRNRWSSSALVWSKVFSSLSGLRGGGGWRRPVMVKVILVYAQESLSPGDQEQDLMSFDPLNILGSNCGATEGNDSLMVEEVVLEDILW